MDPSFTSTSQSGPCSSWIEHWLRNPTKHQAVRYFNNNMILFESPRRKKRDVIHILKTSHTNSRASSYSAIIAISCIHSDSHLCLPFLQVCREHKTGEQNKLIHHVQIDFLTSKPYLACINDAAGTRVGGRIECFDPKRNLGRAWTPRLRIRRVDIWSRKAALCLCNAGMTGNIFCVRYRSDMHSRDILWQKNDFPCLPL